MSNKKILLTLLALYSSLSSACEPEEQRELIVSSLAGTRVSCPLGSMVLPTTGNFNGYELAKANPDNKSKLEQLFAEIADRFGFEHHHPLEFKFVSYGEGRLEFNCVNSQAFFVRINEAGKISLEIGGLGVFELCNFQEIGQPVKFLPLFRFEGNLDRGGLFSNTIPWDSTLRIIEDIGQGVGLREYDAIVRKHAADYDPRPCSGFPGHFAMVGSQREDGNYYQFYTWPTMDEAVNELLDELSQKVCARGMADCLLFHTAPEYSSKFKICDKPDFMSKFILINYFLVLLGDRVENESERLRQVLVEKISIESESSELPNSGRLVKVLCPIKEVTINLKNGRKCGLLTVRIDLDCYIVIPDITTLFIVNRDYLEKNSCHDDINIYLREGYDSEELLRTVAEGEKKDRTFRILEFIRPYIGKDKPPLPLFTFTMESLIAEPYRLAV